MLSWLRNLQAKIEASDFYLLLLNVHRTLTCLQVHAQTPPPLPPKEGLFTTKATDTSRRFATLSFISFYPKYDISLEYVGLWTVVHGNKIINTYGNATLHYCTHSSVVENLYEWIVPKNHRGTYARVPSILSQDTCTSTYAPNTNRVSYLGLARGFLGSWQVHSIFRRCRIFMLMEHRRDNRADFNVIIYIKPT